jgi:hypothetical protein
LPAFCAELFLLLTSSPLSPWEVSNEGKKRKSPLITPPSAAR